MLNFFYANFSPVGVIGLEGEFYGELFKQRFASVGSALQIAKTYSATRGLLGLSGMERPSLFTAAASRAKFKSLSPKSRSGRIGSSRLPPATKSSTSVGDFFYVLTFFDSSDKLSVINRNIFKKMIKTQKEVGDGLVRSVVGCCEY